MKEMFAPYAPPSAVLAVIQFYRKRDVPASVNLTNLQQIGVTEALAPRVLAALKFLNLLNEDGTTTEQFRAIRYASDDDYTQVLTGILEAAYKGVLDHLDITTAGERELNNAFIPYSPGGQRQRMITLFQALAKEAGWPLAVEPKPSSPRGQTTRQPRAKGEVQGLPRTPGGAGASSPPAPIDHPSDPGGSAGLRLSVTDADLMALPDADFDTVWKALGLLQKAKRQAALDNQRLKDAIAASRDTEEEEEQ
jgi:hypothetical protein